MKNQAVETEMTDWKDINNKKQPARKIQQDQRTGDTELHTLIHEHQTKRRTADADNTNTLERVSKLCTNPLLLSTKNNKDISPLHLCVYTGDLDIFTILLEAGADINALSESETVFELLLTAIKGVDLSVRQQMLQLLLQQRARIPQGLHDQIEREHQVNNRKTRIFLPLLGGINSNLAVTVYAHAVLQKIDEISGVVILAQEKRVSLAALREILNSSIPPDPYTVKTAAMRAMEAWELNPPPPAEQNPSIFTFMWGQNNNVAWHDIYNALENLEIDPKILPNFSHGKK